MRLAVVTLSQEGNKAMPYRGSRRLLGCGDGSQLARQRTGLREDDNAVAKDHERRDRTNAEVPGDLRLGFSVDFGEQDVRMARRGGFEHRRERAARRAPRRPEIDDRERMARDRRRELRGIERDDRAGGAGVIPPDRRFAPFPPRGASALGRPGGAHPRILAISADVECAEANGIATNLPPAARTSDAPAVVSAV